MDRIRFGIIGSGWRSLYYVRAALASADRFELCGMVCRRKEKAAVIAAEYGIPVFTDPQDLLKASPMFVVVAVDKAHVLEVSIEWLRKGIAVLAETPAAADIASLRLLRETIQSGKKAHYGGTVPAVSGKPGAYETDPERADRRTVVSLPFACA